MRENNERLLQGLGLAAVFGLILWRVVPRGITIPGGIAIVSLRPDFWPITLCVLLIALSLCLALTARFGKRAPAPAGSCGAARDARPRAERFRPLAVLVLLAGYYAAMQATGLVLPSILACLVLTRIYGARLLPYGAAVAVALPIVLYFFFTRLANVPIPVYEPLQILLG